MARDSEAVITGMGDDEATQHKARALYKSLRRNIVLPEARQIVTNTPEKNPFEAWRHLFGKYDPCNDASAQRMMDTILDKKELEMREDRRDRHEYWQMGDLNP